MSLSTSMSEFLRNSSITDPGKLARAFLRANPAESLVPLLAEEFTHMIRGGVRNIEVGALAELVGGSTGRAARRTGAEIIRSLRPVLDQPYRIGDGAARRAGEMTVGDWEIRRAMLQSQRSGIDESISFCDRAIEVIKKYGVSCLDEVVGLDAQELDAA